MASFPPDPSPATRADVRRDTDELTLVAGNRDVAVAVEGDGTITVSTRRQDDSVIVSVSDDGMGIADERLTSIFTPELTQDGKRMKTGMGLFIGDRIIRLHGGRIEVESKPGVGTTFRIILPIESTPGSGPIGHSGVFRRPSGIQDRTKA